MPPHLAAPLDDEEIVDPVPNQLCGHAEPGETGADDGDAHVPRDIRGVLERFAHRVLSRARATNASVNSANSCGFSICGM